MFNLVDFSYIKTSGRMDAEFYRNDGNTKINFVRLKDICEFIETGPAGSVLGANSYKRAGIKVIRPSNLDGWNCENGQFVFVDREKITKRKIKIYKKGDILAGRIGDFKCGIIDRGKCVISSNLLALRVNKKLCNPYFLLAYLNSESAYKQIQRITKKVSLSSINTVSLSGFEVPLLPLKTQMIIVRQVQKAFKLLKQSKAEYCRADQILRDKIFFGYERDNLVDNFFRSSQLNENKRMDAEFYCDNVSIDGQSVDYRKLSEIGNIKKGIEPGRKLYSKNGVVFLRPSNIGKSGFINKSQKFISMKYYKKIADKYQPGKDEILLVKDGKIGFACVITNFEKAIISSGIVRIKVREGLNPYYVAMCLNSEYCTREMIKQSEGSLVPHLNINSINKINIPIADNKTQKIISKLAVNSYYKYNLGVEILKKTAEFFCNPNKSANN